MKSGIQRLELVDRRFPALLSGEKRDTIRWNEGHIEPGYLIYYASDNSRWKTMVWVTATRYTTLASLAPVAAQAPEELLAVMRRHYPNIELDTEVLFVEHLSPQETRARYGVPEDCDEALIFSAEDL